MMTKKQKREDVLQSGKLWEFFRELYSPRPMGRGAQGYWEKAWATFQERAQRMMVFKWQRPIATSGSANYCLYYNESRTVEGQISLTALEMKELFPRHEFLTYWRGFIEQGGKFIPWERSRDYDNPW